MSIIEISKILGNHCHGDCQGIIELTYDQRKKARLKTSSTNGQAIGLFLPRGQVLSDGCYVATQDNLCYQIKAKAEQVMVANCDDWLAFSKVCYHLGNRHLTLQINELELIFHPDNVLRELCQHYGLQVKKAIKPFNPLNGAYGDFAGHSHNDGLDHSHEHALANRVTDEHQH